jgi:hypothetical protein
MPSPSGKRSEADAVIEGMSATAEQADAFEASLVETPDDLCAHLALLGYYGSPKRSLRAEFERHALWIIENVPAVDVGPWLRLRGGTTAYETARVSWLMHLSTEDVGLRVVSNAMFFFREHDPELAETVAVGAAHRFLSEPVYWEHLSSFYVGWLRTLEMGERRTRLLHAADDATRRRESLASAEQTDPFGVGARLAVELGDYARARSLAEKWLASGTAEPIAWKRSNSVHAAHTTLGLISIRQAGDHAEALEHLVASVAVKGSPHMTVGAVSLDLAADVVRGGNADAGLRFLGEAERLWTRFAERLPIVRSALTGGDPGPFLALAVERSQLGPGGKPLDAE